MRDFQQKKVYRWEDEVIFPKDQTIINVSQANEIVRYIWQQEGYEYPPIVSIDNDMKHQGSATRMNILIRSNFFSTVLLLHELAHSMTYDVVIEQSDGHGPDYVGIYMQLLQKYMKMDLIYLMGSAASHGIRFNLFARPYFLD